LDAQIKTVLSRDGASSEERRTIPVIAEINRSIASEWHGVPLTWDEARALGHTKLVSHVDNLLNQYLAVEFPGKDSARLKRRRAVVAMVARSVDGSALQNAVPPSREKDLENEANFERGRVLLKRFENEVRRHLPIDEPNRLGIKRALVDLRSYWRTLEERLVDGGEATRIAAGLELIYRDHIVGIAPHETHL
jgi:hypothetical protein